MCTGVKKAPVLERMNVHNAWQKMSQIPTRDRITLTFLPLGVQTWYGEVPEIAMKALC